MERKICLYSIIFKLNFVLQEQNDLILRRLVTEKSRGQCWSFWTRWMGFNQMPKSRYDLFTCVYGLISKHYNLRGCSTWHCLCYYSDMFRVFWYTLEEKSFDKKIINLLKMDFFFVLKGDSSHQQSGHSGSCSPEVREVRQKDRIPPPQWRGQGQNSTDSLP